MLPNEHLADRHNTESISVDHGIIGIFGDRSGADIAYDVLTNKGYTREDINILMSEDTKNDYMDRTSPLDSTLKEAAVGSAIGGTIGAIVGAIATIGTSIVIPGIGLVAGPIAGALAGGGTFAVGGATYAATLGLDNTEERLDKNILELKKGEILLSFRPKSVDDADDIVSQWRRIPNVVHLVRHDEGNEDAD